MKNFNLYIWSLILLLFAAGLYAFWFQDDPFQQIGILSMLLAGFLSFFAIKKLSFNEKDKIYKSFIILSALISPLTVMQILQWHFIYLVHDFWGILSLLGLLIAFIRKNRKKFTTDYASIFIIGSIIYFLYSFVTSIIPIGSTINFWVKLTIISIIALLGNLSLISKKINDKQSIVAVVTIPANFLMIAFIENIILND